VQLPADPMLRLAVDRARRFQVLKEEAKHHCLRQLAQLRRVLVQLDQHLDLNGGIFHLHMVELPDLVNEARAKDVHELIAARAAAENSWHQVRLPTELSVKDMESLEPMKIAVVKPGNGELAGTRVSGTGEVEGRVRVLHDAAQVSALKDGEIVVARLTDPAWYPLFSRAGGVVTEVGGWLSHAAIVAREFNLTAVVGVRLACEQLQTGDMVRLHADGRVARIGKQRESAEAAAEQDQASDSTAA
jgi:phosphohistidine swiveling domain-containing protein